VVGAVGINLDRDITVTSISDVMMRVEEVEDLRIASGMVAKVVMALKGGGRLLVTKQGSVELSVGVDVTSSVRARFMSELAMGGTGFIVKTYIYTF